MCFVMYDYISLVPCNAACNEYNGCSTPCCIPSFSAAWGSHFIVLRDQPKKFITVPVRTHKYCKDVTYSVSHKTQYKNVFSVYFSRIFCQNTLPKFCWSWKTLKRRNSKLKSLLTLSSKGTKGSSMAKMKDSSHTGFSSLSIVFDL